VSLDRAQLMALVDERVANENLRRHMLASEAIMRVVAAHLGQDADAWGLAGLGHDLDAEQTEGDFTRHGREAADLLAAAGAPDDVVHAVAAHNPATGAQAERPIDVALVAADQLSGLITAAALVRPDRKLDGVQVKSLRKRFRETAFARGVERASIQRCEELGISLDDFFALGLSAMQGIAPALGM
jgi:putative nucleotidyltransferase with HDIG domain